MIYTSGSTGRPKGVAIEHHSTVALLAWAREVFTPEQLAGVLASTSICFDLSVFEIFVPLSLGGKVILVENTLHLPAWSTSQDVTLINTTPSAMTELVRIDGVPASVCVVNLAGEPLQNTLVQRIYQQETIQQVFNLYGPSEDTTYSTFALMKKGCKKTPYIGRPIANTQIYILDRYLQPVPINVPGELYIGGAGLARGYFNRPQLSSEKFIPNPFSDEQGDRLYKTGDLACYLPDGNIEFLGRIDHQVKIRGFRIELGEVQVVLEQHPTVQQTVVTAQEDILGNKRLVAYVVSNQEQAPTSDELRRFLKEKLPEYMVPSAFVMLATMPLTPNGKVDRRALPAPDTARRKLEQPFVAPRTPIEKALVGFWVEVLGVKKVGIHDNFFELGGHSLLATQVISRLRDTFSVELPVRIFFEFKTVAGQAKYIERLLWTAQKRSVPVTVAGSDREEIEL